MDYVKYILKNAGLEYVTVGDIINVNPFYKIKEEISNCDAIVCLAFIKYHRGTFKRRYFTSTWLDVELSLAFANNLRYYIFCDNKIEDTCIISKAFKTPKINYVNNWKSLRNNQEEISSFFEWLNSI